MLKRMFHKYFVSMWCNQWCYLSQYMQFYVKIFEVFPFLCSLFLGFHWETWDILLGDTFLGLSWYTCIWNCIFHHLPIVNQRILNLTKCTSGRFIDLVLMESDSVTEQATAGTQVSKRSSWYSGYVHHMTSSTGQTRRLSGVHDFWEGGK